MSTLEGVVATLETPVLDKDQLLATIYTPLPEALAQLQARRIDPALQARVAAYLENGVPEPMRDEPRVVLARHLVTPNYEIIRFLNVPDSTGIKPLFFEYLNDKMIYKNPFKYYLGKLRFHLGLGKQGGPKTEAVSIIDFDSAHGRRIADVRTRWGDSLVNFHHNLFTALYPQYAHALHDASAWYEASGNGPQAYYRKFLALFIRDGILFENFLIDERERAFTQEVVLPAFMAVYEHFGLKPLVVALAPTDIEEDEFWYSHPHTTRALVEAAMQ